MKQFTRFVCMILVLSLLLVIPVYAEATTDSRGSIFFSSYGTDLYKVSSTKFEIWFDVDSNAAMMDVLGVREIVVYRSQDQQTWTKQRTYTMERYPVMIDTNSYSHIGYVTYTSASVGYYYRALVTFYAQDSRGIGERAVYTEILSM